MSVAAGPDINEQGLVLYLDAANRNSYSGTLWNSLINTVSASFSSTITSSSQDLGSITFDGSTHADFNLLSLGSTLTVEMWVNLTNAAQTPPVPYYNKMLFGWNRYDMLISANGLGFNTGTGDTYGIPVSTFANLRLSGNWKHYVFEMRSDVSYTNNKMWIDGVQQTLTQQAGAENASDRNFNNGQGRIGGWKNDTGYRPPMSCSVFKVYNRALSINEILQNYNALRSRYPDTTVVPAEIVTSGLVLNLDAGNRQSYPGSGTAWTDIVNFNNYTLTNGPTYSSTNEGNIVFDGSNDYMDFFAANLTSTATVEMWANLGAGSVGKMLFGWNTYDLYYAGGTAGFGYNTGNSDVYGISDSTVTSLGLIGNWRHYIFEMRSDVTYTNNNKIYVNAVSQTLSQLTGTESAAQRTFNSGQGRLSGWRINTSYPAQMNCGVFRVYNRALTTQEISQNYNALRTRYGL